MLGLGPPVRRLVRRPPPPGGRLRDCTITFLGFTSLHDSLVQREHKRQRKVYNERALPLNFPNDEVFLTTEEVLEYLQVNLRTVYRLIKAGKIPAVRVGRQWRFRKQDIDAWLDSQRSRNDGGIAAA